MQYIAKKLLPFPAIKVVLFLIVTAGTVMPREPVALIFGDTLFLQRNNVVIPYDTLLPAGLHEKKMYTVNNLCAYAVMLLKEQGCDIYVLQQFKWKLDKQGMVAGSRKSFSQLVASDYTYKKLSGTDIQRKPGGYDIRLFYDHGGSSIYDGRSLLHDKASFTDFQNSDIRGGYFADFDPGSMVLRKIFTTYIQDDPTKNIKNVIDQVEKQMDSLRLDMNYKTPVITDTVHF